MIIANYLLLVITKTTNKKKCKIHNQCKYGEVCDNTGVCRRVGCSSDDDCKRSVNLPSTCLMTSCNREVGCTSDADCHMAGKNFRCSPDDYQCKPSYGPCNERCDCTDHLSEDADCVLTVGALQNVCMCR